MNAGTVTLSPVTVAPVCQVGDQLELTCNNNETVIKWSFTVNNDQLRRTGLLEYPRFINTEDESQQISEVTVNSTIFTFMRISARGSLPMISTLVINSVSRNLNGTVVHCTDVGTSTTASTTIHLFGTSTWYSGILVSCLLYSYVVLMHRWYYY